MLHGFPSTENFNYWTRNNVLCNYRTPNADFAKMIFNAGALLYMTFGVFNQFVNLKYMYFAHLWTFCPSAFCTSIDRRFIYVTLLHPSKANATLSTDTQCYRSFFHSSRCSHNLPISPSTPMDGSPPLDDCGHSIKAAATLAASRLVAHTQPCTHAAKN